MDDYYKLRQIAMNKRASPRNKSVELRILKPLILQKLIRYLNIILKKSARIDKLNIRLSACAGAQADVELSCFVSRITGGLFRVLWRKNVDYCHSHALLSKYKPLDLGPVFLIF